MSVTTTAPVQQNPQSERQSPQRSQVTASEVQTNYREQSPIVEQRISRTSQPSVPEQEDITMEQLPADNYREGLELDQPPFFKLKSLSLLKLLPGKGWAKVAAVNLYMAKCVQLPDQSVLIVGGAKDQKSLETQNSVLKYRIEGGKVIQQEMAPMLASRSSFGCTQNVHTGDVYVAGGYTKGVATRKCEMYNVAQNEWKELPPLNEEKCSASLCVMGGRYLYCVGGFSKSADAGAMLLSTIEMLDLQKPGAKWVTLAQRLPQPICDMGSCPLTKNTILLFGGWSKTASQNAYTLELCADQISHTLQNVRQGLEKPDFFMVTGVGMRQGLEDPHKFKVCGHACLYTFNTKENQFEGSSTM